MTDWTDALSRLECAWSVRLSPPPCWRPGSVVFDGTGETLGGFATLHDPPHPHLVFLDAETGAVLFRDSIITTRIFVPVARGFFVVDTQESLPFAERHGQHRLIRFLRVGEHFEQQVVPIDAYTRFLGASPTGDRVLLSHSRECVVHAWPSMQRLLSHETYSDVGVDWESGCYWEWRNNHITVHSLEDGRELSTFGPQWGSVNSLGHGVAQDDSHGIVLRGLRQGWTLRLLSQTSRKPPRVSLSSDGRGVRVLLGGKPRRFEVDVERGQLLHAPADAEYLGRAPYRLQSKTALWHPHADAVVYSRRQPTLVLRSLDGTLRRRLSDGLVPRAWSNDGRRLVLMGGTYESAVLEVWQVG